jgi:Ankyrin repeats (3 copies)
MAMGDVTGIVRSSFEHLEDGSIAPFGPAHRRAGSGSSCLRLKDPAHRAAPTTARGDWPLHTAARLLTSLDVIQYLWEAYPSAQLTKNEEEDGQVPLHVAAQFGELDTVQYLVDDCPHALRVQYNNGSLQLHVAVQHGSLPVERYLVNRWEDALHVRDLDGWLPIHVASACLAELEVVRFLAYMRPETLREGSNDGSLPLHLAVASAGEGSTSLGVIHCLADEFPGCSRWERTPGGVPCTLPARAAICRLFRTS